MNFFSEFLRQEVPKSGTSMPAYYHKALLFSEAILAAFFVVSVPLLAMSTGRWEWPPIIILVANLVSLSILDRLSARLNLACFSVLVVAWLTWFVHMFGWSAGSPNILVPVLSLAFFNIYVPPKSKIVYCLGLISFRVLLFAYSLRHPPVSALTRDTSLSMQIINSIVPLVMLSINFILFSSSVQDSERTLTIHNEALHREAGTDPLTGLPNRRAMLDVIDDFRKNNPENQFCIAIADIDFFKRVNDTYGHNCGDYTLVELAKLFLSSGDGQYTVCRWGGEEFCFFLPNLNIDKAGAAMEDLRIAVGKMPLHFGGVDYNITITVGVEEYDFTSETGVIVDLADRKLYMGKVSGRDKVVI